MVEGGNENNRVSARDVVFRYVLDLMTTGKLLPGDVLFETTLAEDLGLSRTPVRTALTRLVSEGFLENSRNKRGYRIPDLSLEDMKEVFLMREILESKAAFFAAEQARKEDVDALWAMNDREKYLSKEGRAFDYYQVNLDFHFTVVRIAGNRYLERSFRPVFWRSQLYVSYLAEFHPIAIDDREGANGHNSPKEHASIIEAIARRDPKGAAKAAETHVTSTRAYRISTATEKAGQLFIKKEMQ